MSPNFFFLSLPWQNGVFVLDFTCSYHIYIHFITSYIKHAIYHGTSGPGCCQQYPPSFFVFVFTAGLETVKNWQKVGQCFEFVFNCLGEAENSSNWWSRAVKCRNFLSLDSLSWLEWKQVRYYLNWIFNIVRTILSYFDMDSDPQSYKGLVACCHSFYLFYIIEHAYGALCCRSHAAPFWATPHPS